MWVDDSDTSQLAQRLRVGPRELLEAIGGPWFVAERFSEHESEQPGTLFVGRAGESVGILVGPEQSPAVLVGVATGEWQGAHPLLWTIVDPLTRLQTPEVEAPAAQTDRLLTDLGAAVDACADAKAPLLVVCRYCGRLVAPERAVGEELCMDCGTRVRDIAY